MSLFDHTIVGRDSHNRIVEFLNDPTLSKWNEIADIRVTVAHTLWNSCALLKPKYLFEYDNTKHTWKSFPDSIMLGNAIKAAVKYEKDLKDEFLFWPRPAA